MTGIFKGISSLFLVLILAAQSQGATYYVSNFGSDDNVGTKESAPWRTVARVQREMARGRFGPGDAILFERGGVWYEELDIPSGVRGSPRAPLVLGNYGSGPLPVIDGGSRRNACIQAVNVSVAYITVDGFECRNTTAYGINFNAGFALPGIVIANNYVHHTGPGACAGCGTPYDDNRYRNQINFEIDHAPSLASGVKILNNKVANVGGHNAIQVHGDAGGPLIRGNVVLGPCVHNCIDLKGVVDALVDQNVVTCPTCTGHQAAFYAENTMVGAQRVIFSRNIVYAAPIAFQLESGTSKRYPCLVRPCSISAGYYNNTVYVSPTSFGLIATSCRAAPISLIVKNNIFDGGRIDIRAGCGVVWDYNDDGGRQGLSEFYIGTSRARAYGPHDLFAADPLFVAPTDDPPNFALQPRSPCLYAGTDVGLPYSGRAPSMGAIDPGQAKSHISGTKRPLR